MRFGLPSWGDTMSAPSAMPEPLSSVHASSLSSPLRCTESIGAEEEVRDMVYLPLPALSPAAEPTTTALGSFHVKWRRCGDGEQMGVLGSRF